MAINPLTGMEEDENIPAPTPTPMPEQFANLKPPPVVYPDAQAPAPMPAAPEPMAPAPMPAPEAPRFGPVETTETQTTTRQTVMTPEERKLMQERDAVAQQQIATAQKSAEIAKAQAQIEVQKQNEVSAMAAKREEAIGNLMAQADEELAAKTQEREAEYEKFKSMEFKDYWQERGTGSRVIAAIAVGLGQLGAGMQGQSGNTALDIINKQIEMDFNKQKAAIDKQQTQYGMAKEGEALASSSYAKQLQNLQLKEAAAYETVAAKYASMLAAQGVPAAQIQADANVQALQAQALDKKLQVEKELRNEISTTVRKKVDMMQVDANGNPVMPEKPLTEGQGNAVAFAKRMTEGIKNYDKAGGMSPAGADKVRKSIKANAFLDKNSGLYFVGAGAFNVPDLSEKDRLALQGIREVITAGLRKDSGAAIGVSEFENEFDQLVPRAGDTSAVIKQKRGTVTNRIAAIMEQAGPGRGRVSAPPEPQQQAAEVRVINGTRYRKVPGGWEAMQ
jgi:hypothetical protein